MRPYVGSALVTDMGRLSVKEVLGSDCYLSLSKSISPWNKVQEATEIDYIQSSN